MFETLFGSETGLWSILFWTAILGLIPAYIARKKGYSFFAWWMFGTSLWIVALPAILILKPKRGELDRRRLKQGEIRAPSEQLTQLAKLRADGALTEEEFNTLKAKIISGINYKPDRSDMADEKQTPAIKPRDERLLSGPLAYWINSQAKEWFRNHFLEISKVALFVGAAVVTFFAALFFWPVR